MGDWEWQRKCEKAAQSRRLLWILPSIPHFIRQRQHKHCYYVSSHQEFCSKNQQYNCRQSSLFTDVSQQSDVSYGCQLGTGMKRSKVLIFWHLYRVNWGCLLMWWFFLAYALIAPFGSLIFSHSAPPPKKNRFFFQKTLVGNHFSVFTGEEQICCFVGERFLDK